MNRTQRRAQANKAKKEGETDLSEKISLFGLLPDDCSYCEKPFDKKDKEMVKSWSVVVREKEEIVRLYCPTCWEHGKKLSSQIMGEDLG